MVQTIRKKIGIKMMALFLILVLISGCFPWQIFARESLEIPKQIIVVKNEMGEPIEGAVFEIKNQKKEIMETSISDERGRAEIFQVEDGIYKLVQIKTQDGYLVIKEQPIEIKTQNPVHETSVINILALAEPEIIEENQEGASKTNEPLVADENKPDQDEIINEDLAIDNNGNKDELINTTSAESITVMAALDGITVKINRDESNPTKFIISTVGYAGKTGITKVLFPTWSERSGQDDIQWYEGTLGSNGEYSASIDIKDHGFETGIYNLHTYFYGLQGEIIKTYVGTYTQPTPSSSVKVGEVINNSYKVTVTGLSNPVGVTGVYFPTWSDTNGQDDLRWEPGIYMGNDTWEATINLKDYKQTYDTFISHVYCINKAGKMILAGTTQKTIDDPFNQVTVEITKDLADTNRFIMSTKGLAGKPGVSRVSFPTWSENNGQNDLCWYQGTLGSNGEYSVSVDIKDHGFETGTYNVHTYLFGLQGQVVKTFASTWTQPTPSSDIKVSAVTNNSYKISITGISNPKGVARVAFPTWTQINGQDDLRWEPGIYVGNDTWEATIDMKAYNQSYDTFVTHAYLADNEGKMVLVKTAEKVVENPFRSKPIQVSATKDSDPSKFKITTINCAGQPGIEGVAFPVWTNRNGQDEIRWYQGTLGINGEYSTVVDIENHGFETGNYSIHTYGYGKNSQIISISANAYIKEVPTPTIEYDNAVLNNIFKIRIKNIGNDNGVDGVLFPTWSKVGGQDDIRWEQPTYIGDHTWEATINLRNYCGIVDDFITHAYLVDKNGKAVMTIAGVKTIVQNTSTVYGDFAYPLDKNYRSNPSDPTDWFGPRWGSIHEGIDIPAPYYASCYAVGNGIIEKAGYFMGYGRYVRIRTTDRYGESVSFFYGHLQEINVSVGQTVKKGDKVGSVGGSGFNASGKYVDNAYGAHLHFGAIANADFACVDPEIWIDFHNPYNNMR